LPVISVEQTDEQRLGGQPLADRTKVAALFRTWHAVRELAKQAEHLGDRELMHFLGVTQLLIEERARSNGLAVPALEDADPGPVN
jgi:hypothetical protein